MRLADDVLGDTAVTFSPAGPGTLDRFSREYPGPPCTRPAISVTVGGGACLP
jgi:hypothetical protein